MNDKEIMNETTKKPVDIFRLLILLGFGLLGVLLVSSFSEFSYSGLSRTATEVCELVYGKSDKTKMVSGLIRPFDNEITCYISLRSKEIKTSLD